MMTEPDLVELRSVTTESLAEMIILALRSENIEARSIGALTSGFRAEAPGEIKILVRRGDVDRANKILSRMKHHAGDEGADA